MPKFKVLRGAHNEGGRTYGDGDIVDSKSDLAKHNSPGSIKFEPVSEDTPVGPSTPSDGLDDMTVAQLKTVAEEEGIDLGEVHRKGDMINVIRAAMQEA